MTAWQMPEDYLTTTRQINPEIDCKLVPKIVRKVDHKNCLKIDLKIIHKIVPKIVWRLPGGWSDKTFEDTEGTFRTTHLQPSKKILKNLQTILTNY